MLRQLGVDAVQQVLRVRIAHVTEHQHVKRGNTLHLCFAGFQIDRGLAPDEIRKFCLRVVAEDCGGVHQHDLSDLDAYGPKGQNSRRAVLGAVPSWVGNGDLSCTGCRVHAVDLMRADIDRAVIAGLHHG